MYRSLVQQYGVVQRTFDVADLETKTVYQIKQILDDFIQFSSLFTSAGHLINILDLLENLNTIILTDSLIINHEFYSLIINVLKNLFKKWHKYYYLPEFESFLFHHIIELLLKIKVRSENLIQSIKRCLKDIAKNGKHLYDKDNMKDFSSFLALYIQDEEIINAIVACLRSKYYLRMFERTDDDEFLLITCPQYWITYRGIDKEEMANILLNSLLKSLTHLLQLKPSKQWSQYVTQLFDLLNYSFTLCSLTIFTNSNLKSITSVLLLILNDSSFFDDKQLLLKSILRFLLTLINNNEIILQYVQQRKDMFESLLDTEDEACIIVATLMDDSQIQSMIDSNENFKSSIKKYFEQSSNGNDVLTKRIKSILDGSIAEDNTSTQRKVPNASLLQSIFSSNENENKEGITLLWYDQNISTHDDSKQTIELLQKINDYVLICSSRETCIEHIGQITKEKIFLILSGLSAQDILDEIHNHQQIDSIYIFCMKSDNYETYLNNNTYSKVIGIYIAHDLLLTALHENIRYSIKQSEAASLFDQNERSMRNLNQEIHTFKDFRAFKQVLSKTKYQSDEAKNEMIEICRNYYRKNSEELKNIEQFQQAYKSEDAILWYTRQTFVYRLVNKALRTEDYEALITLRFFIVDLCENLKQKYEDFKERNVDSNIVLFYRGFKLPFAEIYNLKNSVGKTIATNGFLSTSRSKNVALRYAKKGIKRSDAEAVLLEINVNMSKITVPFIDTAQYSDFPAEQEVLFDLGASFSIDSTHYDIDQKIWFVKLTAVSEESLFKYIQILLDDQNRIRDMNILLGTLLYDMEKYSICQQYFEKLLNFYDSEQYDELATIYSYIGRTYFYENDFDKAIDNYKRSCDYYLKLNQLLAAAVVTNLIGINYSHKEDRENARYYCTKSHELWKQLPSYTSTNPHCEMGRMFNMLGCLEDDNQLARDYFFKALHIYKNSSDMCRYENFIAETCENIATKYHQDNDDDQALKYIMKSVNIRKKDISTVRGRKNYIICLVKLNEICRKNSTNIWSMYENQYYELFDAETIKIYPQYKEIPNILDNARRLRFNRNNDRHQSTEFLAHSLKTLQLTLTTDSKNYEKIIQANIDIGRAYINTKDYQWSRQHCEQALEIYRTNAVNNSKLISTIFELLSNINLYCGDDNEAFHFRMEALNFNNKSSFLTDKEKEAQCYFDLGEELLSTNSDKALEFTNKSFEIRQLIIPKTHVTIGFCHHDIAAAYNNKCMFDQAIEHYKIAIEIYEKHLLDQEIYQFDIQELYKQCHSNIAQIYLKQKTYDEILYFQMKALSIDKQTSHLTEKQIEAQCYFYLAQQVINKDPNKALEFTNKALEIRLQILPDDHVTIGYCHYDIAAAYKSESMFDKAIEHYKKALEIYEKHLYDKEIYECNVSELYSQCHLKIAEIYLKQNKYDETLDYNIKALNIDKQTCHLTEEEKVAKCYFDLGKKLSSSNSDKALELLIIALNVQLMILSEDHVTIAFCYQTIGDTYENKCMFDEATECYKTAIEIYEKHLFDKETYQLDIIALYPQCHSNIAECHQKQKNYDISTEYFNKAIKIMENDFSSNDRCYIGHYYSSIGSNYYDQFEYDLSIEYYQKCLNFVEINVCNHTNVITSCLINLSRTYLTKGEYQLALDCLGQVKNKLSDDHIHLGICHFNIGLCYINQNQYEKGIENYQIAIKHFSKHLPLNQENYALCYMKMSIYYSSLKKQQYINGINCTLKTIEIYEQYYPDDKTKLAQCYFFHGYILLKKGLFNQAINALQTSLEFRINEHTINIAQCYHILGECYYKNCDYERALLLMKLALTNYEEHFSDIRNENIAYVLNNIALCSVKLHKCNEALEYVTKSLEVSEHVLPVTHMAKAEAESILALIYSEQYEKCHEHCMKALKLSKELISNGDYNEDIWSIFENIGGIYMNQNNLRLARKYYKKALKYVKRDKLNSYPKVKYIQNIVNILSKYSPIL